MWEELLTEVAPESKYRLESQFKVSKSLIESYAEQLLKNDSDVQHVILATLDHFVSNKDSEYPLDDPKSLALYVETLVFTADSVLSVLQQRFATLEIRSHAVNSLRLYCSKIPQSSIENALGYIRPTNRHTPYFFALQVLHALVDWDKCTEDTTNLIRSLAVELYRRGNEDLILDVAKFNADNMNIYSILQLSLPSFTEMLQEGKLLSLLKGHLKTKSISDEDLSACVLLVPSITDHLEEKIRIAPLSDLDMKIIAYADYQSVFLPELKSLLKYQPLCESFVETEEYRNLQLSADVRAICYRSPKSRSSWPEEIPNFPVPEDLDRFRPVFCNYLKSQNISLRIDRWELRATTAIVTYRQSGEQFELLATAYQVGVLLLFNHRLSLTFKEICDKIGAGSNCECIYGLIESGLLLRGSDDHARIRFSDKIRLNPEFESRKPLVKLTKKLKHFYRMNSNEALVEVMDINFKRDMEMIQKFKIECRIIYILKRSGSKQEMKLFQELLKTFSLSELTWCRFKKIVADLHEREYVFIDQDNIHYVA